MCITGVCVDKLDQTHECICPLNMTGRLCADTRAVPSGEPRFDGRHSYIAVASPTTVITDTKLTLKIKPDALTNDALLFYAGENAIAAPGADYLAVVLENERIAVKYDSGAGPQTVQSDTVLQGVEWIDVVVERVMGRTRLIVNGVDVERRDAVETTDVRGAISIGTELMIGGTAPGTKLPHALESLKPFAGCVSNPVIALSSSGLQFSRST